MINVVTRDRVVDTILKDRIDERNVCEKHFPQEQILRCRHFSYF